ncbi:YfhO family protein [Virgibacillus senegalensis]|uniref:YfhO family protein n=1 Tax=Virgibacillus senegalensis TaxID=1499679 RepID=UPI00069E9BC1|nr:YfhO family protein [Virgibacillus senegalensis]
MKKYNYYAKLVGFSVLAAVAAHAFFLYQLGQGGLMAGPNDGLSQMAPFRSMLYQQFTEGNLFYSFIYGLGGSTFTQLAYYYGINAFFYITTIAVYSLELLSIVKEPNVQFWLQATVFISIVRMTIVLVISTCLFRYMKMNAVPAFTGALLYAACVMYFRHVTYWEFFGDAFLWLPLLVLGVEKVIREQKPWWLITAMAVSLFDNFYFAFTNFCFIGMYAGLRLFIRLTVEEAKPMIQLKQYAKAILLGFGIGSVGFVPAVWGLFHNFRPGYDHDIPLLDNTSNILFDSHLYLLPAIFVLFVFISPLYRNNVFRLFTFLALLFTFLHFVPLAASFFNGMSAPQHRFEYVGFFSIGGAVAAGLHHFHRLDYRELIPATVLMVYCYVAFYVHDESLSLEDTLPMLAAGAAAGVLLLTVGAVRNRLVWKCLIVFLLLSHLIMVNQFQVEKLYEGGEVKESTKDYVASSDYYSEEQKRLIDDVIASDKDVLPRIEWKTDGRNNTPLIQGFPGTSVYSSILNKELLYFYYYDLEIDMKRESVSRLSGFGDRANLYSLFGGKYIMFEKNEKKNIPYGFTEYMESEHYMVYRNRNSLPFVRTSNRIYTESALADASVLDREHAMLNGIVLADENEQHQSAELDTEQNVIDRAKIRPVDASYDGNQLNVTGKTGGIDIYPDNQGRSDIEDYYLSFYLLNNDKHAPLYPLHVNEYKTSRKSRQSIYRTKVDHITIRVPQEEVISLRVPKGSYSLKNIELFKEDYQELKRADKQKGVNAEVELKGNKIEISFENKRGDRYMTVPVPYEKGWRVYINGEKQEIDKTNYAFLGTKIQPGHNNIRMVYYPPYFGLTVAVALVSLILTGCWNWKRRKKQDG